MHTSCPWMGWDLRRRNQVDAHVRLTPRRQPQSRCPRTPSVIITYICVLTYDPTESVHASRMAKTTLQQPTPTACMCVCTCTTTLFLPLLGPLICSFRPRTLKPTLEVLNHQQLLYSLPAACNANICDIWRYVHWSSTGVYACIYQLQVASCFLHLVVPTNLGNCSSRASTVPHYRMQFFMSTAPRTDVAHTIGKVAWKD
jgi:hypothetical protein